MFTWLKREAKSNQDLVSIVPDGRGIAYACVAESSSSTPMLNDCYYQEQLSDPCTTLRQLDRQRPLDKSSAATVMQSGNFMLLLMQTPAVEEQEIAEAVRWQIKDQLDYPAEEAIIEVLEIPGQRDRGRMPMIYVVVAHRDIVQANINLLEQFSVPLQYIDIPELSQRNIAALLPEDANGVALLRFEANHGLLTITHDGELYLAREFDVGFTHFIEDVPDAQTEESLTLEDVPSTSDSQLDYIVLEIQRSLDYYESHFAKPAIATLVLAPMEVEISGLASKLEQNLGATVRELDMNTLLDTAEPLDNTRQAKCFIAIGAALRWAVNNAMINRMN